MSSSGNYFVCAGRVKGSLDCERDTDASVRLVCKASFRLKHSYHVVTHTLMYPAGRRRPHRY